MGSLLNNADNYVFPALKLGTSKGLKEGEKIVVIGYPGLVSGEDDTFFIDPKASAGKPTVTRGIISAIKADYEGRTIIQTDASIDHGNSATKNLFPFLKG